MTTVTLSEIAKIHAGGRLGLSGNNFVKSGAPAYGAAGRNGYLDTAEYQNTDAIILSSVGARCGKCFLVGGAWTSLANTQVILPDPERADPRFLWYQLNDELRWHRSGSAQPFIKPSDVKSHAVYLPLLDEQRRLAAILDHADALRAKRRQVLAHLDTLTQSIFHDMFPVSGLVSTVGEVAEIQGGLQVSAKRAALPVEAPYLRVANVRRGRLDLAEVKTLRGTAAEISRTQLVSGDLLFVEGHANPQEVGRVAIWTGEIEGCVHQNHLIRARLNQSQVLPMFASVWLNTRRGAAHFHRAGRTTSGLNTISASTVRSAPIPLAELGLQQRFAERVQDVHAKRAIVQRVLATDDELFASLQCRAFRGAL